MGRGKALLVTAGVLFSCASVPKVQGEEIEIDFRNGEVSFRFPNLGYDSYRVYERPRSGKEKIAFEIKTNFFSTPNYASTFRVVPMEGKGEVRAKEISNLSYFGRALPGVDVYSPKDDHAKIQQEIDRAYGSLRLEEWADKGKAMLFLPGNYDDVELKLGYYTSISGLGLGEGEVSFKRLYTQNHPETGNALINFWRTCENALFRESSLWAVSQATSLRRTVFEGDLTLSDFTPGGNNFSSGGFIANSRVEGNVNPGTQQQWFFRNSECNSFLHANINMVFEGSLGEFPSGSFSEVRSTIVPKTSQIKEKPYIAFDLEKGLGIVEESLKKDALGAAIEQAEREFIPLDQYYIARPEVDDASSLNLALKDKKGIVFTPGTYSLKQPLQVDSDDKTLLGLGLASLRTSETCTCAVEVGDVDGFKAAGLLLEAGNLNTECLLRLGKSKGIPHVEPNLLSDVFFRVGGKETNSVSCEKCLEVNADGSILDNIWAWRADHGKNIGWDKNFARHGVVINGNDVIAHGLFVEHFCDYQTLWKGENGRTIFYQSETPYDSPSQEAWSKDYSLGEPGYGYASYKIASEVSAHQALGLGIYWVNMTGEERKLFAAVESPEKADVKLSHIVTRHFYGLGGIENVVNNDLGVVESPYNAYLEDY